MKLNLGAGNRIVGDATNHDITKHRPEIDITHDLNITPWPWDDCSFDQIEFISVAEHLKLTLIESLNECWRILKPDGILIIKYPIHTAAIIHDDPTHRWFWSDKVLDFVDPSTKYGTTTGFYTPCKWEILERGTIKDRNIKAMMRPIK